MMRRYMACVAGVALFFFPALTRAECVISEIMSDNASALFDADGDSPDWIELHNTSASPASLNGWYLSDDPNAPTQWVLPNTNIAANGFLIVFASGKDRAVAGGELHANFKISASGESVVLTKPDGTTLVDGLALPAMLPDASYGYAFSNGVIDRSAAGLLTAPTPGAANTNIAYAGVVEPPVVFPGRGFYDTAFSATASNLTDGAVVRYTTDGSEPTESSPVFPATLPIDQTTTLRVRAFKDGWQPSWPRTDTYLFTADVIQQPQSTDTINGQDLRYGMDTQVVATTYIDANDIPFDCQDALKAIPSISVVTDDANLYSPSNGIYVNATQRWERAASIELINPDGEAGFHINGGLRIRGGWSRHPNFVKHSLRLFFRDEYGDGELNYPLFGDEGVDSFAKVDLRTAQNYSWPRGNGDDRNTFVRDVFARDCVLAMGQESPRSRYYHLYLNGLYWGLFMTEERPVATFGESYYGGDRDEYDTVKVQSWTDPDGYAIESTDGTLDAYYRLYTAAMAGFADNAAYFAAQGMDTNGLPDPALERLVDVDNLIDYLMVINYVAASDNCITTFAGGYQRLNNMYAIYNRVNPDGFKWFQHDSEHSLDTSRALDFTGPFNHSNFTLFKYFNAMTLNDKLVANEEYRLRVADRAYKHLQNGGALTRAHSEARLDARAAQIDRAIVANAARWGNTYLDRDVWTNAVATTRAWLARSGDRCNEVISYLAADGLIPSINPPTLSHPGGMLTNEVSVSLSAAEGTIYFTTNGLDPRAVGGGIVGTAYSTPVSITHPTHVKARCRKADGEWSALTEAFYWNPDIPLAFTEVMYHAPAGNPHDFIELKNSSDESVALTGYKLDGGISYAFKEGVLAPNEYVVVVDDLASFAATYPTNGLFIAGEYRGDLGNGGEKVKLEFHGNDLIAFTYSDARNWPQAADGAGHSLVPLDTAMADQERASLDYGGNWRASTYTNGSPGFADPVPGATVLLNEVTAHTDTGLAAPYDSNDKIELYNPTAAAVNIGGWSLSDDRDDLNSFVIPGGTTISAGGFVVFDEDDFHTDRVNGFGLNKAGEQVYLTDPSRGVVDSIRFKGQENGTSYGRYPDGASDWLTTSPTLAAPNVPYAQPFQIAEVMYNPLPGEKEYIVIESLSDAAVPMPLFNATGPYRIDGGVAYGFPAGTTLVSGEKIWIVGFDPADSIQRAAFKAAYGLSGSDRVFGPYQGDLSNRGERVALERPQDSDDPARPWDISWVVVDELFYFDRAPWPESADGFGVPLVRSGATTWTSPPGIVLSLSTVWLETAAGTAPSNTPFEVWTTDGQSLGFAITSDVPWISVSPSTGTIGAQPETISLSYDTHALSAGSYTGRVEVSAPGAYQSPRFVEVALELYTAQLSHFLWGPIADQMAEHPFSATITAYDQRNAVMRPFTGTASILGERGDLPAAEQTIGTDALAWSYPMYTYYEDSRSQVIYLQSEVGDARVISSLALNVSRAPSKVLNQWTIRMRHTSLSQYDATPSWENDWTTVFQEAVTVSDTGWTVFEFSTPFAYDGVRNLMIDFSQNNTSWESNPGQCLATAATAPRSFFGYSDSQDGDPLNWVGTATPSTRKGTSANVPNLILASSIDHSIAVSPTTVGPFADGIWTGELMVATPATNVVLQVDDGAGHVASTEPFLNAAMPDTDGDQVPDWWEMAYFGSLTQTVADVDFDGLSNVEEYIANTNPTNGASLFTINYLTGTSLFWEARPGRTYSVWWTDNLTQPFVEIATGLTAGGFTDIPRPGPCYYRLKVEM